MYCIKQIYANNVHSLPSIKPIVYVPSCNFQIYVCFALLFTYAYRTPPTSVWVDRAKVDDFSVSKFVIPEMKIKMIDFF